MIFVILGTQDKKFYRLLDAIQKQIDTGIIKEKIIVQAGYSSDYKTKDMEIYDLLPMDDFKKIIKESKFVITHAGVGSILDALKNDKKVIAAARLKKYKEHTNDHQVQICKKFSEMGYIIELKDFNKLGDIIKEIDTFKPKKYCKKNRQIIEIIENFINKEKL